MQYENELERLATLDADAIARVCASPTVAVGMIDDALDECLDLEERADEYLLAGDLDHAAYCRQEAAAWRATVTVLRALSARSPNARRESDVA